MTKLHFIIKTSIYLTVLLLSLPLRAEGEESHLIYGVPYEAQPAGQPYCGPASLYMVLKYWNDDSTVTQEGLVGEVFNTFFQGTLPFPIKSYLEEHGYIVEDMRGEENLDIIKEYIKKDMPVIVVNSMTSIDNRGHFRVVIGFDDEKGEIITHDPALGHTYIMTCKEFLGAWKFYKYYMMVFYPPDYEKILEAKTPAPYEERTPDMDAKVHSVYARSYLRASYYQKALEEAAEGLEIAEDSFTKLNLIFLQTEAFIELGYLQEAENALKETLGEELESIPWGCYLMGRIKYLTGQYSEALYYAKKGADEMKSGKAFLLLGMCQKKLGRKEMATVSFKKALEVDINLLEALEEINKLEER